MKRKEELVLVGHRMFCGGGGGGGGGSLSFLRRFCHWSLFQLILIDGLCRELKAKNFGLCLNQFSQETRKL